MNIDMNHRKDSLEFYKDKKFGWESLPELDKEKYKDTYNFDFFIKIDDLIENPYNIEMYGKLEERDAEYLKGLEVDIDNNGLSEPLKVFKDACLLVDGHHRLHALKKLGLTYVPVSVNHKYKFKDFEARGDEGIAEMMDVIFRENSRPERGDYDRWKTIFTWVVRKYQDSEYIHPNELRLRCSSNGLDTKEYWAINDLSFGKKYTPTKDWKGILKAGVEYDIPPRNGDDDLLGSVKGTTKDGIARKASNCVKNMVDDWKNNLLSEKQTKERTNYFDNLITSENMKPLLKGMLNNLKNKMNETLSLKEYGILDVNVGQKMSSGEKSTMCHRYLEAHFGEAVKFLHGIDYEDIGENEHFDYLSKVSEITENKEFAVEFKTTIKGENFTSNLPKNGYNLLVALDEKNLDRVFVAYVYAKDLWKQNSKNSNLTRKVLYDAIQQGKGKILFGDLTKKSTQHKFVYEDIIKDDK
jgi:hypothetical protein